MKALVITALLLVVACSDGPGSPPADDDLSPGIVERVAQIELGSPVRGNADSETDDPEPRFGKQIVVRLDDGRTVILVYTGARRFQAGQRVRVHVSDLSAFSM
jgi:hypothetical protein